MLNISSCDFFFFFGHLDILFSEILVHVFSYLLLLVKIYLFVRDNGSASGERGRGNLKQTTQQTWNPMWGLMQGWSHKPEIMNSAETKSCMLKWATQALVFCDFLTKLFVCFLLLFFENSLYIPNTSPLLGTWFANIFCNLICRLHFNL